MTDEEIRLRCLETAAKFPNSHVDGQAAGVIAAAHLYESYVAFGYMPKAPVLD